MANIPGTPGNDTINGTNFDDILNQDGDPLGYPGTGGDDRVYGYAGNDRLYGGAGRDILEGGEGDDLLFGGVGDDPLYGQSGHDRLFGGAGTDYLSGGVGRDILDGGTGADRMFGGAGDDTYYVDDVNDEVVETTNDAVGGYDTVFASVTHTLGFGIQDLFLTGAAAINGTGNGNDNNLYGNDANNVLSGLDGADVLDGGKGNDQLFGGNGPDLLRGGDGNDTLNGNAGNDGLNGGNGNDVLTGGSGRDALNGESGNDRFDYNAVSESPTSTGRDIITGFAGAGTALGDQIDLRDIDANTLVSGNQVFTWKGATPGGAGTLWYSGGVLYGNVDGDATPEFQIQLVGSPALVVGGAGTDILL